MTSIFMYHFSFVTQIHIIYILGERNFTSQIDSLQSTSLTLSALFFKEMKVDIVIWKFEGRFSDNELCFFKVYS